MADIYQIEYTVNGVPSFFEFFLFVNPLGQMCYKCEEEVIKTASYISAEVDVNVLTYHNHQNITDFMERLNLPTDNLALRNKLYQIVYQACIAYKASTLQGKRMGREFLNTLQETTQGDVYAYSHDLALEIADHIGLDIPTFQSDFRSDYTKELFKQDQRTAYEMSVQSTPALVIFEHRYSDEGRIIHHEINPTTIVKTIDALILDHFKTQDKQPDLRIL